MPLETDVAEREILGPMSGLVVLKVLSNVSHFASGTAGWEPWYEICWALEDRESLKGIPLQVPHSGPNSRTAYHWKQQLQLQLQLQQQNTVTTTQNHITWVHMQWRHWCYVWEVSFWSAPKPCHSQGLHFWNILNNRSPRICIFCDFLLQNNIHKQRTAIHGTLVSYFDPQK